MVQLALCCMSHSPLLNLPGPSAELLDDIGNALADARAFVGAFDPELVVIFAPDHYNGFFYKVMPPFCIGTAATGVGDYGTHAGPLDVPQGIAIGCAAAVLDAGIAYLPPFLAADAVRAGSLVAVLPRWKSQSMGGMSFVYAGRKYTAPKVQAFIQIAQQIVASQT